MGHSASLAFANARHGWLMFNYQTSSAFSWGGLYETNDGGRRRVCSFGLAEILHRLPLLRLRCAMCSGEMHISFLQERARDFPLDSFRWRDIEVELPFTAVSTLIDRTKNFVFRVVIQKRKAECLFRIAIEIAKLIVNTTATGGWVTI